MCLLYHGFITKTMYTVWDSVAQTAYCNCQCSPPIIFTSCICTIIFLFDFDDIAVNIVVMIIVVCKRPQLSECPNVKVDIHFQVCTENDSTANANSFFFEAS